MIGESFGHYKVLSRLGGGGMGEVYLAEDERLGRKVALKFLAPDLARNEEAVERFRNEARVAAGLSHANIAAIHGFDQHDERWFHIHEYVEGETLEQRLSAGPLSIDDARHLLVDLARGLGHAHARGVIHRDIKPANVMITPEGTAKILDFGLARRSGSAGQTTQPGVAVGTVAYMSPEQLQGEIVDARSDLWSLGVLMYQSLIGTQPFAAEEMAAAMNKILREDVRPLRELRPEVTEDLENCVERCLRKQREERFARADDVLAVLGLSSDSRMSHSAQTMPAQASGHRRGVINAALGFIVIIAAVGIWWGTRGGDTENANSGDGAASSVSETVVVEDEFGQITQQQVVDSQYRQKLSIFFSDVAPEHFEDDWLADGLPALVNLDLFQDPFVVAATPYQFLERVRGEGSQTGRDLSSTVMRKLARERMSTHFLTSKLSRTATGSYSLELTMHETESGRAMQSRVVESDDVFELADAATIALREDLPIPEVVQTGYPDLPVKELMTDSVVAYRHFVLGAREMIIRNDYDAALDEFGIATQEDSTFALAHFMRFAIASNSQNQTVVGDAGEAMMRHVYRLPSRLQYMVKANYYINIKQDPEKAFAVTKMWAQLHPDDEDAYRQLAAFHELRNEPEEQIVVLEEILRIDPTSYATVHQIAQIYQNLGQFDESAKWMQKYVEAYPDRSDGYEELAELYFDMGNRDAAMEEFERALLIDDRRPGTIRGVALIHMREGRYDEANASFEEALRVASSANDRAAIHEQRRNLLERQGRIQEAMIEEDAQIAAVAEVTPPSQVAISRLAGLDLYATVGRAAEALTLAQQLSTELPEQIKPIKALGTVMLYVALEQAAEAREDLDGLEGFVNTYKVERIRPLLDAYGAAIADLEGDNDSAIELLKKSVANQISSPRMKRHLAGSLRKAGRSDEAERELEASLVLDPTNPQTHLEYARLEQSRGDAAGAREHLALVLATWESADAEFEDKIEALELQASLQN